MERSDWFVCAGCKDLITHYKFVGDKEKNLCDLCLKQSQLKVCPTCKINPPNHEFWGQCKECWDKSIEELEREGRQKLYG